MTTSGQKSKIRFETYENKKHCISLTTWNEKCYIFWKEEISCIALMKNPFVTANEQPSWVDQVNLFMLRVCEFGGFFDYSQQHWTTYYGYSDYLLHGAKLQPN